MEENNKIIDEVTMEKEDGGNVNISNEVVGAIAGIATCEIDGVYDMAGGVASGIAEKLGAKKSPMKGVKVDVKPEGATIDLYIIVEFGARIPDLAWSVQQNVKNSVETMTGIDVLRVNVHIDGLHFKDDEKPSKKQKEQKEPEPVVETDPAEEIDPSEILEDIGVTEEE